ncbi:hypothetical protein TNCV_2682361 [Trichonephila clavipes]|nr:hypothetical protein TNCV_2682361 [Trichonephila clavipes]
MTSGCFYPRSNHWEVGGRPQCDKCGCRVRNCSQHRFTTLETISNYRNSYPGFSSGSPRGTTPTDDRYICLTDESRFSLSSDSHRILIWRERGSRNHPSNIIERDRYGGHGVLVWEASCLVVIQTFTSSTQVQSTGSVIVTRLFFHMCVFLEALRVCSSFSCTTMHHVIAQ